MYGLVLIRYRLPLEEVVKATEEHRAYLKELKAKGILLAAGPFDPRTGGAFLVRVSYGERAGGADGGARRRSVFQKGRGELRADCVECGDRQRGAGQAVRGGEQKQHRCGCRAEALLPTLTPRGMA